MELVGKGFRVLVFSALLVAVVTACGAQSGSESETTGATTADEMTTTSEVVADEPTEVRPPIGRSIQGQEAFSDFAMPISITAETEWVAAVEQPGAVILEYPEREAPFTRAVLILHAEPFGAATVDEWVGLQEDVALVERQETQIDGFAVVVYDLTYDGVEELPFLSADCCGGRIILRNTEYYRVWAFEDAWGAPLVVFSPVLRGDTEWFQNAEDLVNSMQIG